MIEKIKTSSGHVLVSENYIDVSNRERPDLLRADEGLGQVWVVVDSGMSVHRFFFADPEEADTAAAVLTYGAAKARARMNGQTELHGEPIGPLAVTDEYATTAPENRAATQLHAAAQLCEGANGGEAAREYIAKALAILGHGQTEEEN